jgi:hypothetical protein
MGSEDLMKNFVLALLLVAVIPVGFAHADDKPYGPGGCGLGSMVMGKDGSPVLTMTTNETGTQTFGISSGTSNCFDGGVVRKGREARAFIEINQRQLANDISKGQGDAVSSLARLYQCQDERQFGATLQNHYQQIFPDVRTSVDHVESSIQDLIRQDQKSNCHIG